MTFRKESFVFHECAIYLTAFALLCLLLIPYIGLEIPLLSASIFVLLTLISLKCYNKWITIDENGITCQKLGKQIWTHKWDEIVMLKKGTRFRWPSVEIITYDKYGNPELYGLPDRYFLLGKKAKTAINTYCPTELNKLKKK